MKKILPIAIVSILVLSGLGASALINGETPLVKQATLTTKQPIFTETDKFITVSLDGQTANLMLTGKPILPVITWTTTFEPNTVINNIQVTYNTKEYVLDKQIQPGPQKVPLLPNLAAQISKEVIPDPTIYKSAALYPAQPYTIDKGVGLDGLTRVLFVNVRITPQYSPANNVLYLPDGTIDIKVEYTPPESPLFMNDEYDLLIITPAKFESVLQDLADHKESIGIRTIIDTTENIYSTYSGRDEPEDIKLRIKDAIEDYNIKYVILAGGRKGQTFGWYIPERRTYNDDGWETGYASDLYYADIYKVNGNTTEFDDWDSNGNDIFGEWWGFPLKKDIMDFYPDVYVGRLPIRYSSDARTVVDKIITYETTTTKDWFEKAIVIAGDTFAEYAPGYYEGEMETAITAQNFQNLGFEIEKLWTSLETLTGVPDVVEAISGGAGFVHFAGHGNPASWSTHPPEDEEIWINGLQLKNMRSLRNGDKLPFVVIGGCHNGQFNVTMMEILRGIQHYGLFSYFGIGDNASFRVYYMEWVPRDMASWFLLEKGGGSIGTVAMSSLGYGGVDAGATQGLGGWIEPRIFDAYANQDIHVLGEMHGTAIKDYINIIGNVNSDNIDRKTIEAFTLLGDPSLTLG